MTLEEFKIEILKEKVSNYTEKEIENLFNISIKFAEFALHKFKEEKTLKNK